MVIDNGYLERKKLSKLQKKKNCIGEQPSSLPALFVLLYTQYKVMYLETWNQLSNIEKSSSCDNDTEKLIIIDENFIMKSEKIRKK